VKLIPAPWPILHTPRGVDTVVDAHGNDHLVDGDPVVRYVVALYQTGYRMGMSSKELLSDDYLNEVSTTLHMVIPQEDSAAAVYGSGDQVTVGGVVDGADYVGGVAFRVDGIPATDLEGPWPHLYKAFGGMVKIRRIG